ncbi:MAG TPA: threonine/serine exporter family protein [Aggregatilineaceae bacterium]|nr:threonine/serine exporter family protein [Aggregatilineaceae bacterium]
MTEPEYLSREELAEVLDIVLTAGQAMLQSGAVSFRTEKTMAQIGLGMGADRLELYVTPTGIIATAFSGSEQRTRVGRVGMLGVNMAQIVAFYKLARYMAMVGGGLSATRHRVALIKSTPRELPTWFMVLAVGLACGAFSQMLGGGVAEFIASMGGAMIAQLLRLRLIRAGVTPFAITVFCGVVASLLAYGISQGIHASRTDLAMIGSVLLLVPGVPLVNSVIDLSNNDLVSAVSRGTLALMLVLSIGIGIMLTLWITGLNIVP